MDLWACEILSYRLSMFSSLPQLVTSGESCRSRTCTGTSTASATRPWSATGEYEGVVRAAACFPLLFYWFVCVHTVTIQQSRDVNKSWACSLFQSNCWIQPELLRQSFNNWIVALHCPCFLLQVHVCVRGLLGPAAQRRASLPAHQLPGLLPRGGLRAGGPRGPLRLEPGPLSGLGAQHGQREPPTRPLLPPESRWGRLP